MSNVEPLISSELERMLPLPDGSREDWSEVLRRAGVADPHCWRRWRPILVAAVVVAALVGVGVAIAAGFGAFDGISAAQHPATAADKLDPALVAAIDAENSAGGGPAGVAGRLLPDSARLVGELADGARIYAVATSDGQLCVLAERLPASNATTAEGAAAMGCGSPLTQSQPATIASFRANQDTPPISWGIALDSVRAVSFMASGQEVTVPVKNNVWVYQGDNSGLDTLTVHFNNGSTETMP